MLVPPVTEVLLLFASRIFQVPGIGNSNSEHRFQNNHVGGLNEMKPNNLYLLGFACSPHLLTSRSMVPDTSVAVPHC